MKEARAMKYVGADWLKAACAEGSRDGRSCALFILGVADSRPLDLCGQHPISADLVNTVREYTASAPVELMFAETAVQNAFRAKYCTSQ